MNKSVSFPRIANDLFQTQLKWTFYYMGMVILVDIVRQIISNTNIDTLYNQFFLASNVYMFVIGIIAVAFLRYFVENGVTRKNYFLGNLVAAICLSILIPIISYVVTLLEGLVLTNGRNTTFDFLPEMETNFIGDILQSMLLTPYIDLDTNILLSLALFSLNIFVFYIIGWLISTAFYRLGVIGGLLFTVIAIALIAVKDTMLRIALDLPIFESFSMFEIASPSVALLFVFIVIAVTLVLTYLLTRRAPIKI